MRRVDAVKNTQIKAQMLYYLANYYALTGNDALANKFFTEVYAIGRKDMIEWRLNENEMQNRNIVLGQ
ncbi:MAG: hypothetical protein LBV52_03000 [Spirochaetaceae bacterium]|nr:hypothetical protein [Spirochaetaceae bacterium]